MINTIRSSINFIKNVFSKTSKIISEDSRKIGAFAKNIFSSLSKALPNWNTQKHVRHMQKTEGGQYARDSDALAKCCGDCCEMCCDSLWVGCCK